MPLCLEIGSHLAQRTAAGSVDAGGDDFPGIGGGRLSRRAELFDAAHKPSSLLRRDSALNLNPSSMGEFRLEGFFAPVERGHHLGSVRERRRRIAAACGRMPR